MMTLGDRVELGGVPFGVVVRVFAARMRWIWPEAGEARPRWTSAAPFWLRGAERAARVVVIAPFDAGEIERCAYVVGDRVLGFVVQDAIVRRPELVIARRSRLLPRSPKSRKRSSR